MTCDRCGAWTFSWMAGTHRCPQDFTRRKFAENTGWISVPEPHDHSEWLSEYDSTHRIAHDFPNFAWPADD